MKIPFSIAIVAALLAASATFTIGCHAQSKISGTYVVCGSAWGRMLQLTQTPSGQITGVMSDAKIERRRVTADTEPVTAGTLDGAQLTLTLGPGWAGTNISGVRDGNTIRFQGINHDGSAWAHTLTRGTVSEFNNCATQLQRKAAVLVLQEKQRQDALQLNFDIGVNTRWLDSVARDVTEWIQTAQKYELQIPARKAQYRQVQEEMERLIKRERVTPDRLDRGSLSLDVGQKNLDGGQLDIAVDLDWGWPTEGELEGVAKKLVNAAKLCNEGGVQKPRVEPSEREKREAGCRTILAQRSEFPGLSTRIMEERAALKLYQAQAKILREATFAEAERLAQ